MTSNLKSGIAKFGDFDTYFMPTYELIDNNIGGTIYTWGYNDWGQQGSNDTISRSTPAQIFNTYYWKKVSGGYSSNYFLNHNGELYSAGSNVYGQLGVNYPSTTHASNPVQIAGSSSNPWVDIEGPRALKADGTLWAWGYGFYGQIGDNAAVNRSSPVQVIHPNGSKWWKLGQDTSGQAEANFCIDEYGYLWGWGSNASGQLGDNTVVRRSTPVQIGSDQWKWISSSTTNTAGIKSDGTLWTWGFNLSGQLGLNDRIYRSTPTQVGTDNTWKQTSMSSMAAMAIKQDGTLWAIGGDNGYGGLGLNDRIKRSTPTQIGTGTDWKYVSSNGSSPTDLVGAVKTDGTLWTWGADGGLFPGQGRLGQGTPGAACSTPTQITSPNVKWKSVSTTIFSSTAISAGQGAAGAPNYHVTDTQSTAGCYSGQGGFSLDIVNGQAIMYFGLWPSDPPNCQTCYGAWLAFGGLGVDRTGANSGSNGWRIATNTRPYWGMGGAPLNLTAIPVGTTTYWQSSNWPYTLVGYTYAVTKTTSNSITIQTYPNSWGTGDTGTSVSVYSWFDRVNTLWGGYNAGKAGWVLGTGTFSW